VDDTGVIWLWNDPLGTAYPDLGVSANRAPWANGPVSDPSSDAAVFIEVNGLDAVNRDQVSIGIAGQADDPLTDECLDAVAQLSAYFADRVGIPWDVYPTIPQQPYDFVRWHNEFASQKLCPGAAVIDATPDIIVRTQDILRKSQVGG
jgi:hypothetical protein